MAQVSADALERAARLRLMVFDVDGVLTDGRLWYGPRGEELKAFHVRDGHGLKLLAQNGVVAALLTGRRSKALTVRAAELGLRHVLQGVEDKRPAFDQLLAELGVEHSAAGYMGDDLPDLPVLGRCGFACAPPGAHELNGFSAIVSISRNWFRAGRSAAIANVICSRCCVAIA
jgi:3-deoxy-D-manno-octulosonate 8-phosphate phosphatase (KDO 8-P phosphatase)